MTDRDRDKIESAIRHIQTSVDIDPWAMEIAVEAMERMMPKKPMASIDIDNKNLLHLYCPTCGTWVGMYNKRLRKGDMHNNTNRVICGKCGQVFALGEQDD